MGNKGSGKASAASAAAEPDPATAPPPPAPAAESSSPPRAPSPTVRFSDAEPASAAAPPVDLGSPAAPSLVDVSVSAVPREKRLMRRLKPKAPSSCASSASSAGDNGEAPRASDGGILAREPVSLRDFELLKILGKGSHGKVLLVRKHGAGKGGRFAMKIMKKSMKNYQFLILLLREWVMNILVMMSI